MMVDMPGYGFAFANEQKMAGWKVLIDQYIQTRKMKRVFLIIDGRHGVKQNDKDFMQRLDDARVSFQIILTKCDLVKPEDLARRHALILQEIER